MPTYQYECDHCQHTFEVLQSMMDKKLRKCPSCGKLKLYRLIGTGAGVIFKGSGFYETDYKNSSKGSEKTDTQAQPSSCSNEKSSPAVVSKDS